MIVTDFRIIKETGKIEIIIEMIIIMMEAIVTIIEIIGIIISKVEDTAIINTKTMTETIKDSMEEKETLMIEAIMMIMAEEEIEILETGVKEEGEEAEEEVVAISEIEISRIEVVVEEVEDEVEGEVDLIKMEIEVKVDSIDNIIMIETITIMKTTITTIHKVNQR